VIPQIPGSILLPGIFLYLPQNPLDFSENGVILLDIKIATDCIQA
jgi:hypothetical protein